MGQDFREFTTEPPATQTYLLSVPAPHTLLITINRPKAMNAINFAGHWEADRLMTWFDSEPSLNAAVVTGAGSRAFCAGQDLIEQNKLRSVPRDQRPRSELIQFPYGGFMAISRRNGKKPVVAAVNGLALGGGFEIVLNCDLVVASPNAVFALPEVSRGLYAAAGGLARLVRICGLQVASEIALTGRQLTAEEALKHQVVNRVSTTPESVVDEAIALAGKIADFSPDAVIVTRHGLRMAWEEASVERAAQLTEERFGLQLRDGENIRIGLDAFANKKKPQWVPSKL